MYFLGIDLGTSFIKLSLVDITDGELFGDVKVPDSEMSIIALHKGWAEQDPNLWWDYVCDGIHKLLHTNNLENSTVQGIGITYQMHGLVVVDKNGNTLRDAIIWCDSRAVHIGEEAANLLGAVYCQSNLMNAPGNFTASKLNWVRLNEPDVYKNIFKFMLPGDFIAYKLTGKINTTITGLTEGIFWDFNKKEISKPLQEYFQIDSSLYPEIIPNYVNQGTVSLSAAKECGLKPGTPILFRSGDQPNNASSLNVFEPGQIAATAGTSGVIYAITEKDTVEEIHRVNNFAHVNYTLDSPSIGKLLCINSTGILYRWLFENLSVSSYSEMNELSEKVPVGSDSLIILPFGNGSERMLNNNHLGAQIINLDLNRHTKSHLCRAALEGIAFSFYYGFEILKSDGIQTNVIHAGNDNLFQSKVFSNTLCTLIGSDIKIFNTNGSIGAARSCCIAGNGFEKYASFLENDLATIYHPLQERSPFTNAYLAWKQVLNKNLNQKA
ncbi:MAG: xylulokinase [Flavobacteriaceae bacterium]